MEDVKLKCKACGSINTNVYKAKDLAEKTGDRNLLNPTMASATLAFSGAELGKLLKYLEPFIPSIIKFVSDLFTEKNKKDRAKEENNRSVNLCIDCGHWERI